MMKRLALFLAAVVGAGLIGMAFGQLAPPRPTPASQAHTLRTPEVEDAQRAIASASFAFKTLHPPPAPIAPSEGADAPPPEPDVAVLFRRDVTAVLEERGRAVVVIVDAAAKGGRRTLRIGARYGRGWKVAAISASQVELRRGRETRRIDLFAPPQDDFSSADSSLADATRPFIPRNSPSSTQKE
jgi:hypothetical protein